MVVVSRGTGVSCAVCHVPYVLCRVSFAVCRMCRGVSCAGWVCWVCWVVHCREAMRMISTLAIRLNNLYICHESIETQMKAINRCARLDLRLRLRILRTRAWERCTRQDPCTDNVH